MTIYLHRIPWERVCEGIMKISYERSSV